MDKKMKKNKAMRAAGGLFVATMLTTSVVSGTYAKYVTEGSASDSARVAVFGVEVKSEGAMFAKTYYSVDDGNTPADSGNDNAKTITVRSSNDDNVVAPGTKSDAEGLTLSVTGTPEVSVKVTFDVNDNTLKDIFLKAPSNDLQYPNMTTSDKTDGFTFTDDYYPIKYTLKYTDSNGVEQTHQGTLSSIAAKLESLSTTYEPGTDLAEKIGDIQLTWEWAFGDDTYNKEDTLLGDLSTYWNGNANIFEGEYNSTEFVGRRNTDYSIDTNIEFTVTVAQVD